MSATCQKTVWQNTKDVNVDKNKSKFFERDIGRNFIWGIVGYKRAKIFTQLIFTFRNDY